MWRCWWRFLQHYTIVLSNPEVFPCIQFSYTLFSVHRSLLMSSGPDWLRIRKEMPWQKMLIIRPCILNNYSEKPCPLAEVSKIMAKKIMESIPAQISEGWGSWQWWENNKQHILNYTFPCREVCGLWRTRLMLALGSPDPESCCLTKMSWKFEGCLGWEQLSDMSLCHPQGKRHN